MSQSRQLAAIMFTDIVGYTALMGNDEQKAFSILKKNRAIQKPIIEQYNGRWIKELDSTLSAPFMTLSFMALLVIPHLKRSDKGLFDGDRFSFV